MKRFATNGIELQKNIDIFKQSKSFLYGFCENRRHKVALHTHRDRKRKDRRKKKNMGMESNEILRESEEFEKRN